MLVYSRTDLLRHHNARSPMQPVLPLPVMLTITINVFDINPFYHFIIFIFITAMTITVCLFDSPSSIFSRYCRCY